MSVTIVPNAIVTLDPFIRACQNEIPAYFLEQPLSKTQFLELIDVEMQSKTLMTPMGLTTL